MKDFSSLDNFEVNSSKVKLESKDESRSRCLLNSTTERKDDRFETGLLWKFDQFKFPDSLPMAKKRLKSLENKMSHDSQIAESLKKQLKEYEEKKYIRRLQQEELTAGPRVWYLPIFIVKNPNKPNKLRIVWDAAAKVNGVSLNSMLLPGPDLLSPLINILYRFRQGQFAIKGDVSPSDDFGATCSPSSAQYVKNINAEDFVEKYPRAVEAIQENHYVDNWLDSFKTEDRAIQVAKHVHFIHAQGGFQIRNRMSNSKKILSELERNDSDLISKILNGKESTSKILGMWWNTATDVFTFKINRQKIDIKILNGSRYPTKREVLRTLMCIYDPLGLLSNLLVYLKILLQDIWRSAVIWDEKIKEEHFKKWQIWTEQLWDLVKLQIPRYYGSHKSEKYIELHTFVDASENAYAAVSYFKIADEIGTLCVMVGSKTKVAPQKPISIPRLELLSAVLGARLSNTIKNAHTINIKRSVLWTDSKTVLYWLKSDARKYRQFVALRIGELLEITNVEDWYWVPSNENVADEATKWKEKPQFDFGSRWFTGPSFLSQTQMDWPTDTSRFELNEDEELKVVHLVHHNVDVKEPITPNINYFSRWNRLVRAQAYFLRSVINFEELVKKQEKNKRTGPLLPEEINVAETVLYRKAQWDCFQDKIMTLSVQPPCIIEKSSQLYKLNPYLDEEILRMHGRIDAADVPYNIKRPIILPGKHEITKLIVKEYHQLYHSKNNEVVINEIRQKYVVPELRILLRKIKNNCQKCKNDRVMPKPPQMSELPKARLAAYCKPFTYTGVDYFGPIEVAVGRRIEKRWGVLFTCLIVRAIHIEIASSLTTNSCIQCLKQFIFSRGCPTEIYSDNGTNFRGTKNELDREIQKIEQHELLEYSPKIKWLFIPPASPHMGGSWERLIRSVKSNLHEILITKKPTDEVLRCCLKEVEFIVNSRPLTYIPLDSEEDEALTPNHFLLGTSNGIKPPADFHSDGTSLKNDWRKSQDMAQKFWKRWIQEYLPTLTRCTKWFTPSPTIKVGDVVVIVDQNNPRNVWPKGIVVDVTRGKNGQVRSAFVKTKQGLTTRPSVKLAVLDIAKVK